MTVEAAKTTATRPYGIRQPVEGTNQRENETVDPIETQDNGLNSNDQLKRELADAHAKIAALSGELDEIRRSTTWRLTYLIRALFATLPVGVRLRIKGALRVVLRASRYVQRSRMASFLLIPELRLDLIPGEYPDWVRDFDTLTDADRALIRTKIDRFEALPKISVVMPVYDTPAAILREAIESVVQQIYPNWELCIADDASKAPHVRKLLDEYMQKDSRIKCVYRESNGHISAASNSALALATGDYVALLDHDDLLSEHALYMIAEAVQHHPKSDVFYSDEDKLSAAGKRSDPHFKPDWSPELFYGQNYLNHLTVYKRSAIEKAGGFRLGFEGSQDYDLALRVISSTTSPIVHIPHVLYHWRIFKGAGTMSSQNLGKATDAARQALVEHFTDRGVSVMVEDVRGSFHRVVRPDPESWPKISVVIPTRDHLDVLEIAVDGLRTKTDYPSLEIVIADNESTLPETRTYLAKLKEQGVQIIECKGAFNYSEINNKAVAISTGELVLLLNNDISMLDVGWLKEMVRYFADPEVGIVGPKLLYPDGSLQHAGVIIGLGGVAGHRCVGFPGDEPGRFARLALAQDVSCVTGACLLMRRSIYEEVGGLDAHNLRVAFNDVDLCLRVQEAGYRIIWTPYAVLNHHESKSRGSDLEGEKLARFQREVHFMRTRWGQRLASDRFFNPNLSLQTVRPALAHPPRVEKPWKH
ncbi:glycosyltransferase family 2 protein [Tardiphaga sp. vice352]|uniref:glycosyltransferase family 2 protein n=1 Tax=Tardiphaga sp. vice352 TaxID=2592816 RepID=UPI001162F34D|nr:glycosyltransferase family 2 protein [Tardiphaga sp. vice352]QDM33338.1 glycosyltransferase family 2 protein [Tardiphaga sp. vice352]